jgi:hypothetical protein
MYAQQLPAKDAEPFEVGPSGYTTNRYWIVTAEPAAATSEPMRALLIALHRAGRLGRTGSGAVHRQLRGFVMHSTPATADPAPS